ncbi:ribokinase [Tissierella creatinini]|nr:ribokinase [Tissierella creatinini]TJX64332.1 ribokinase [Soehngenia saccharolytica]
MKILNLGSLNIDKVYEVKDIVKPGETILASFYKEYIGGKGLNQSVAIAKAGAEVYHAGLVGNDGNILVEYLQECGVDTKHINSVDSVSGHAIIQIDNSGQNSIIVFGGTNQQINEHYIDNVLNDFGADDILLLQNEISMIPYAIHKAKEIGLKVAMNPSPITDYLLDYPLELVDIFILNEIEGQALTGKKEEEEIIKEMHARYPSAAIVLTLGDKGSVYSDGINEFRQKAYKVEVVDTTGAGDTFCGYYLASVSKGISIQKSMELASKASSIAIQTKGASNSIPDSAIVESSIKEEFAESI